LVWDGNGNLGAAMENHLLGEPPSWFPGNTLALAYPPSTKLSKRNERPSRAIMVKWHRGRPAPCALFFGGGGQPVGRLVS
jgi:hypothetical protein